MQKTVFRFGLYGIALMLVVLVPSFLIFKDKENWEAQEILGYITIVISLLFVYFGIRHWRDNYNNGNLSFGQGLKLGTLITLFPAIAFGVLSWLEMSVMDPEFSNKYYNHYIQKIKASTPPEKLQEALQKLESEKELFANPLLQFFMMFLTVFLIGIVITVVSSLILHRKEQRRKVAIA